MHEFYELLGNLNTDIIKQVSCKCLGQQRQEVTLHFEAFAKEFGVAPKTMVLYMEDRSSNGSIMYTGRSSSVIDENNDMFG